jgi:hypothetical protein
MLWFKIMFVFAVVVTAYTVIGSFVYILIEDYYTKHDIPIRGNLEYASVTASAIWWPFTIIFVACYVTICWLFDISYKYLRQIFPRRDK